MLTVAQKGVKWRHLKREIEMNNELISTEIAQDEQAEMDRGMSQMHALMDSADSIEDSATRGHVTSLIFSAINNANDTIDEQAEAKSEWLSVAKRTLSSLIDCGGERVTESVIRWFVSASRQLVA